MDEKYLESVKKRFWAKVDKTDTCWRWKAHIHRHGYGAFYMTIDKKEKMLSSHRVALWFEGRCNLTVVRGANDDIADHLCKNRACVRPSHLRIVTATVNILENSVGPAAINLRKTQCKRGHPFNKENTSVSQKGGRTCRTCHNKRNHEYKKSLKIKRNNNRSSARVEDKPST